MKIAKSNRKLNNKQAESTANPFIKLIEDKVKISEAIQKGNSLGTLKDIHFVKPI